MTAFGSSSPDTAFDLREWLAVADDVPPIVQAGSLVLRRPAQPVPPELLGSAELADLVERMVAVMRKAPGVGLAAPQIGVPLRLFVAEDPEERMTQLTEDTRAQRGRVMLPLVVLVNPSVTATSRKEATFFEGCLSVRGYGALVPRWKAVKAKGVDATGRPVSLELEGWPARIMQHEMDHLDGKLYIDKMISRSFACDAEMARLSALPVADVLRDLAVAPRKTGK